MADQAVLDILLAAGGVTALVGQRVSPVKMSQNTTLPAVVVTPVALTPMNHLNGAPTLDAYRVQLDSIAETFDATRAVANACRAALEAAGIVVENDFPVFEPDVAEYRITQECVVWISRGN